jgi:hypothetical protein
MNTAKSVIESTLVTNPTGDILWKGRDGKGTWERKSHWDLPEQHRLYFTTYKRHTDGLITTTTSVCRYEKRDGYESEQHIFGLSADGDFRETLANTKGRCTDKLVNGQHQSVMELHFKSVLDRVIAKYGSAMKLVGAQRTIREIAREIKQVWPKPYFGAVPYLDAMLCVDTVNSRYGCEDGKTQVIYFLSNAATWRGEDAKRIKAELKALAGIK